MWTQQQTYDNIQDSFYIGGNLHCGDSRRFSARLSFTLYLVYSVLVLKGTRKFSLWTPLHNFKIKIISLTAFRQVEILAVDTAADFPPD